MRTFVRMRKLAAPPATDADVAILAGDIGVGLGALPWVDRCFPDKPVIYVPGNHEYYHHDLNLIEAMKHEAPDHVHVLDNDAVEIIAAASWPRWFVTAIAPEGGAPTGFATRGVTLKKINDLTILIRPNMGTIVPIVGLIRGGHESSIDS